MQVFDVDVAVLGLLKFGEDTDDGGGDAGERGGAEWDVAAVEDAGGVLLNEEPLFESPIEEGAVMDLWGVSESEGGVGVWKTYDGVCEGWVGGGFFFEELRCRDFEFEDGISSDLRIGNVGAKFGRNEALDSCCDGGVHEDGLGCVGGALWFRLVFMVGWRWREVRTPTVETTASWPLSASMRDSSELKSTLMTLTEAGKVASEPMRESTVRLNFPDLRSASRTGTPRSPLAPAIVTFLISTILSCCFFGLSYEEFE